MQAELITRFKDITPEGGIIELVVWRLPEPILPCTHHYKYRAVLALDGARMIGFDNERGTGDHCHIQGQERSYCFAGVDQLIEDFIAEVQRWRAEP